MFLTDFRKILKYQISWKSVQWGLSCSILIDGQTDIQTNMAKLIFPLRNCANAPKRNWNVLPPPQKKASDRVYHYRTLRKAMGEEGNITTSFVWTNLNVSTRWKFCRTRCSCGFCVHVSKHTAWSNASTVYCNNMNYSSFVFLKRLLRWKCLFWEVILMRYDECVRAAQLFSCLVLNFLIIISKSRYIEYMDDKPLTVTMIIKWCQYHSTCHDIKIPTNI